ncbi:hypothetical protein, partial [Acinetobacter baumannii]|uniref:hypothetical protein n=1 Tax=Acinetobacter baumannii TaxID=470 RepID=UPI0037D3FB8D
DELVKFIAPALPFPNPSAIIVEPVAEIFAGAITLIVEQILPAQLPFAEIVILFSVICAEPV